MGCFQNEEDTHGHFQFAKNYLADYHETWIRRGDELYNMIHSFFDRSVYWRTYEEIAVFTTIDTSSGRTFTAFGVGHT